MNRKILAQFILLIILFSIIISVFLIYFNKDKRLNEKNIETNKIVDQEIDEDTGTLITDINYKFSDPSGNFYELFAEFGKVNIKDSEKMFMTNVKALIYLKDSEPIMIVSKYANYHKINHETNFFEDVVLTHLIHKATSNNLDIAFNKNIASMYNNLVYNKPGTNLTADRLEIDLITKNTKIFMDKKTEKIKIVNKK